MHAGKFKWIALLIFLISYASLAWSFQANASGAIVSVSVIVSVEAKHGKEIPTIYKEDVRVFHDHNRLPVQEWSPYRGDQAGLELFILIDDSIGSELGLQLDDLRKFMLAQPTTTTIGIGYIRNGNVEILQNLTADHALAAKALRLPIGSGSASPYDAITDLIQRWPENRNRHEIFMVSSGIDALQPGPNDSYLDHAIQRAQRAGVQVYSIYASRTGHLGHTLWQLNWGQSNLSRLADETGAEAYFQGLQTPLAFGPYLDEFSDRLQHQYRLTFLAKARKKAGDQKIRLETEVPNAELVSADSVFVPAAK